MKDGILQSDSSDKAKLHHVGVRGLLLSWIRDFLTGRTQLSCLGRKKSCTSGVTSGVPQGTVLGLLLFLVFINDIPDAVKSNIHLFTDNALLYRTIHSSEDATVLQDDLTHLQSWEKTWQMAFNPDKCEVLRVTNKKQIVDAHYSIHRTTLHTVDAAKYLSVTIQGSLSWKAHVNSISKKANSTLGFLRRNLRARLYYLCPPYAGIWIISLGPSIQRPCEEDRHGAEKRCPLCKGRSRPAA